MDKARIKAHNIDAILFLMLIVVGFVVSQLKYISGNHYIILTPEGKKKIWKFHSCIAHQIPIGEQGYI